jgi:hypothetical protein
MMATGDQVVFRTATLIKVLPCQVTRLPLETDTASSHLHYEAERGIVFDTQGWYEVLLRVEWDPRETTGTRFAHTKIPDNEPLHSEAINAEVLARISGGRQLLRGNSVFGLDHTTSIVLEVWHDADKPVEISHAELVVRELDVDQPSDPLTR